MLDPELAAVRDLARLADHDVLTPAEAEALLARVLDSASSQPRRNRQRIGVTTATVLAILAGGGAVATALVAGPGPAKEEVDSFVRDAGISQEQARVKLAAQRQLPELTTEARAQLGSAFGGIWVDSRDQRIKLAVVGEEAVPRAQEIIDSYELAAEVDTVPAARSEQSLLALQREIEADVRELNRNAEAPIDVEPDVPAGKVIVRRPYPASAMTPSQRAYLTALPRSNEAIVIRGGARVVYHGRRGR